jgi:hypothetical protein
MHLANIYGKGDFTMKKKYIIFPLIALLLIAWFAVPKITSQVYQQKFFPKDIMNKIDPKLIEKNFNKLEGIGYSEGDIKSKSLTIQTKKTLVFHVWKEKDYNDYKNYKYNKYSNFYDTYGKIFCLDSFGGATFRKGKITFYIVGYATPENIKAVCKELELIIKTCSEKT